MRKFIVWFVAICTILGGGSTAVYASSAPYSYQETISPELSMAYAKVMEDFSRDRETQFFYASGDIEHCFDYTWDTDLIDFDGNGIPELFVGYNVSPYEDMAVLGGSYEIWGFNGKDAYLIYKDTPGCILPKGDVELDGGIGKKGEQIYIETHSHGEDDKTIAKNNVIFSTLKNEKWTKVKDFECIFQDEYCWEPEISNQSTYIDGKKVSYSVFNDELEQWQKDIISFGALGSLEQFDKIYPKLSKRRVKPSAVKISVDGKVYELDAYNVRGCNYFKVRDIAMALKGTSKEFTVDPELAAMGILIIEPNKIYEPVGEELKRGSTKKQIAMMKKDNLGHFLNADTYNIEGYTFVSIRDIGLSADFDVTWDSAKQLICIDTNK